MAAKRAVILFYRAARRFSEHRASQMAASISYYVLLSIFPLLIFSVGVLGLFLRDPQLQADLVDAVLNNIPLTEERGRDDVTRALRDVANSRAIGLVGLATMAWSSSAMFGTVRRSLNVVFDVDVPRPFLRQKAVDLMLVLAFAPFFVASILATTALRVAQNISGNLPLLGEAPHVLGAGWLAVSLLLPMLVSFAAFLALYGLVPARRPGLRHLAIGAIVAALGFEVVKLGFSFYLENFSNYDVVFGSLGAVVAFLFWVFLSANVLLFGAEMAAAAPAVLRGEHDFDLGGAPGPRRPLRQKLASLLLSLVVAQPSQRPAGSDAAAASASAAQEATRPETAGQDSPIPVERLQSIYDRTAPFYDGLVGEEQVQAKTVALKLLARRPNERLLEVGAGTGWLFERVVEQSGVEDAVAIDLAPGMLLVARERLAALPGLRRPPLVLADARALPFRDAAFDCLLCTHTLDVMSEEDIHLSLAEMRRVLRPGGRLVALNLTPGEGEDQETTREWQRRFAADPEYFGGARPLRLASTISGAGFERVERRYCGQGKGWPSEVLLAWKSG